MKSFILISFGFLGWVFFELSDGMDFQTPVNPALANTDGTTHARAELTEQVEPQTDPVEIATTALVAAVLSEPAAPQAEPEVEFVADLETEPVVDIEENPAITLISLEQSGDQVGGLLDEFDPDAIRLSVLEPADVSEQEPEVFVEPELPPADLREITGTRVNMRNGPGTIYEVITRVKLGDEVEVLERSGGWLRLRLVSNRTVGWISASLVSKVSR